MIDKEIKELVLWRLDTIPDNFKLSLGAKGTFSKNELRKHVEQEDDIGMAFINIELNFIKDVSNGKFSKIMAEE